METHLESCIDQLKKTGLLLKTGSTLASVTSIVAGLPVRGSWWSHPASRVMFRTMNELSDRTDVTLVKLVNGKDTFVEERLWPSLLAIATAGEPWQLNGVNADARKLLRDVMRRGTVMASGPASTFLESRLLAIGDQFHTESGQHQKVLRSWENWAQSKGLHSAVLPSLSDAKRKFERILPGARWPWITVPPRKQQSLRKK